MDAVSRDRNITDIPRLPVLPRFQVGSMNRGKVCWKAAGGTANPAEDRARAASSRSVQVFFLPFQSRKDGLFPTLLSRVKRGKLRFDERVNLAASSRRKPRSLRTHSQPTGILATNSKMGNIFLHSLQAIDCFRESIR
jgi:hypothetical protein